MKTNKVPAPRFGVGECYGHDFFKVSDEVRRTLATRAQKTLPKDEGMPCPYQTGDDDAKCTKKGGVCSIRLYGMAESGDAALVDGVAGSLRATCPHRFSEGNLIIKWIGDEVINDPSPGIAKEKGFLRSSAGDDSDDVGRLDMVLVSNNGLPPGQMEWVPTEIQSVYFSGSKMSPEFEAILHSSSKNLIFPVGRRRPDYRSCGPKRLLPQLQSKVTAIRRWGKKTAVVVDRPFFDSLGRMETVDDISNADIAWFVVDFESESCSDKARIRPGKIVLTTLENAMELLTGGQPISRVDFEKKLQ